MERQLKERLVGAAVLMAMAVILIPEMLSGPRRAPAPPVAPTAERSEGNLKRYTIDLNGDLNGTQPAAVPETSNIEAPPPAAEEMPSAALPPEGLPPPGDSAAAAPEPPESVTESPQQESSGAAPVETPAPAPVVKTDPVPAPAPIEALPQAAAPAPPAPAPATGSTRRWAVQLIAYDNRERAQRMAEDLRESNYAAFVMPVQAATGTLYRVRVGPFATRAEADNALRKLKTVTSDPTVVAQP